MNDLLPLQPQKWNLLISPSRTRLLVAIAYLAHNTELIVLDCGRKYDASIVIRAARGREEITDRIQIRRAFICSEVAKLLEHTSSSKTSVIILDFLSTFYDENVKLGTRKFLFEKSLLHIRRLNQSAGLAIASFTPPTSLNAVDLFERLQTAAPQVSDYSPVESKAPQLVMF